VLYWIIFCLFIIFILYISFSVKKPITDNDYFFNNFSLDYKDIFYTFSASWIGAASIILLSEKAALIGINSFFIIPLPTILSLSILFLLRKKILTNENKTLEKIIEKHYGKDFGILSSLIFLWYLILLTSSQMVALGFVGKTFLHLDYRIFIILSSFIIVVYSSLRGYKAVINTDKFQLIIIGAGILILFIFFLFQEGKPVINNLKFHTFSPELLLITLSFTFAWVVSPVSIQRVKSANSPKSVSKGILLSLIFLSVFFLIIICIGVISGESIIKTGLPELIGVILFILLISALFSTIDTMVNSSAMSFYYLTNKSKIIGSFIMGILSVIISLKIPSILKTLGLSSEILTEALFLPVVYSLLKPNHNKRFSGKIVIVIGIILSFLSFGNELFGVRTNFLWPRSLIISLPLLFIIFMVSLMVEGKKDD